MFSMFETSYETFLDEYENLWSKNESHFRNAFDLIIHYSNQLNCSNKENIQKVIDIYRVNTRKEFRFNHEIPSYMYTIDYLFLQICQNIPEKNIKPKRS